MYPLPEEGEGLASLMGYPYKCFLRFMKEYSQIRMAEGDEEKTDDRFSGETYHPLEVIDLRVTLGNERRSKTMLMEFAIIKCHSPYNIIIGRTGMRSLKALKWSVLLKGKKDTFLRHRPEDLKEPETGAAQRKHEGIWGCTLLIPEKTLSPRLPSLRKKSSPWKAGSCGSGKLTHLVKDIRQNNQRNKNPGRSGVKVKNMIRQEENRKRSFKEKRSGVMIELTFPAIARSQLMDEPIILEGIIEGNQVQRILVDRGSSSEIMYEYCFRNLGVNIRSSLKRCRILMIGFQGKHIIP
nr:hypothetical protein [Tanacetum cinerariifolium]